MLARIHLLLPPQSTSLVIDPHQIVQQDCQKRDQRRTGTEGPSSRCCAYRDGEDPRQQRASTSGTGRGRPARHNGSLHGSGHHPRLHQHDLSAPPASAIGVGRIDTEGISQERTILYLCVSAYCQPSRGRCTERILPRPAPRRRGGLVQRYPQQPHAGHRPDHGLTGHHRGYDRSRTSLGRASSTSAACRRRPPPISTLTAFVRAAEQDYGTIGRLLDGGAAGIIAPRIETVAEADSVSPRLPLSAARPASQLAGCRGSSSARRRPRPQSAAGRRDDPQILLETPAGIAAADAIAALDGVDMLAIGANDLSAELNSPAVGLRLATWSYPPPPLPATVTASF